jgi:drug/metabolite transporter (DMT)-like permease
MGSESVFHIPKPRIYVRAMPVRDLPLFVLMAILWGIPYALIAVALGGFDGEFVVWARVAIAAVALVAIVGPRALWRCLHGRLLEVCGFSVVQFTVPLLLVTESERSVPSSLVGCLIASEPLWVAVLSVRVDRAQGSSPTGVAGLVSGIAGVAILLGAETSGSLAGAGLVMAAAASYAWATLLVGRFAASMPLLHLIAGALAVSALTLFPFAVAAWPSGRPSLFAVTALVALAGVCTAVAFPLWFRLITHVGAARAALVTYVSPVVAAALGIAMLGERPGPLAPLGLLLILGGSWLASRSQREWRPRLALRVARPTSCSIEPPRGGMRTTSLPASGGGAATTSTRTMRGKRGRADDRS